MAKKINIQPVKKKKASAEPKPASESTGNLGAVILCSVMAVGMYFAVPFLYDPAHAVYYAAETNRVWLMEYYLKKYINRGSAPVPKSSDFAGFDNALLVAVQKGHLEIAQLLLLHGANPNANNSEALIDASARGNGPAVNLLVSWGADVRSNDDAALLMAVMYNQYYIVKYLLDNVYQTANIHTNDDIALFWAVSLGYKEVVKLLIEYGADPFAAGDRAINAAKASQDPELFKLLRV